MKRYPLLLLLTISLFHAATMSAQNVTFSDKTNKWRLGFNVGSLYQQGDVRREPGFGYGMTLERMLVRKTDAFFNLSLRGRYLKGTSYGLDWQPSYGIINNLALNGTQYTSPLIDYTSNPGFFYYNYQTGIRDLSLEALLYFNRLKRDYNILLYFWGGYSFARFEAKSNLRDMFGNEYTYDFVNATSKDLRLSQLRNTYDNSYESWVDNISGRTKTNGASLGIGLGYMIGKRVSIGIEHKMTFTHTDLLDGKRWTEQNQLTSTNDIYHYSVLGLKLFFGGGSETKKQPTPTPTQSKKVKKPEIHMIEPNTTPYDAVDCIAKLSATVLNVEDKKNISIKENGAFVPVDQYDFNSSSMLLTLEKAINSNRQYEIYATNEAGSASKTIVINCSVNRSKPSITVDYPKNEPYYPANCQADIIVTILNISGEKDITVTENSRTLSSDEYSFNQYNKLNLHREVYDRSNITITARNAYGTATRSITLICPKKPEISITEPSVSPYQATSCNASIKAYIKNIQEKSQIKVTENGSSVSPAMYSFNPSTGLLVIQKPIESASQFEITASNPAGSDNAQVTINCKSGKNIPNVTITYPAQNPFITTKCEVFLKAQITNIEDKNQITVSENGRILSSSLYSFNPGTGLLQMRTERSGVSEYVITATNRQGKSSAALTIDCRPGAVMPEVIITKPNTATYTTNDCNIQIEALVKNITEKSQITVTENGGIVSPGYYSYNNVSKTLVLNKPIEKSSLFLIKATNNDGTTSASVTINCEKTQVQEAPTVTITSPAQSPFTATDCNAAIRATIFGVDQQSKISVTENGVLLPATAYSFSYQSGILSLNKKISGQSLFTITAENQGGKASASTTIKCITVKEMPSVAITQPGSNPFTTSECNVLIKATTTKIDNKSQIKITDNGKAVLSSEFNFNASTREISFYRNVTEQSVIVITVTNVDGSASESITVKCQKIQVQEAPTVTITSPAQSPFTATDCNAAIRATIFGVDQQSKISVTENGVLLPATAYTFSYQSGILSLNKKISGQSLFTITAENQVGKASASTTIKCITVKEMPTVAITQPGSNPFTTSECNVLIKASTTKIDNKSQIKITDNGKVVLSSEFNFNASTREISFYRNVTEQSVIVVTVTNMDGSASESITLKCRKVQVQEAPTVTITSPAQSPFTATDCNAAIRATIFGVDQQSKISVTENGVLLPATAYSFSYQNGILTLNKKISGQSLFTITAENQAGKASASTTIKCITVKEMPTVAITQPGSNPFTTSECNVLIKATTTKIDNKSQIKITDNGKIVLSSEFNFNASTREISFYRNVTEQSVIVITVTNMDGSASESITVKCQKVQVQEAPTVTITSPAQSPFTATDCNAAIRATIFGVDQQSKISVTENGVLLPATAYSFSYQSGILTLNKKISGQSLFTITAENQVGKASASTTIICKPVVQTPSVSISKPSSNPYTSSTCKENITALTKNINSKSQISIYENGRKLLDNEYTFDAGSGTISMERTITRRADYKFDVVNASGSVTVSLSIICSPPIPKPEIIVVRPTLSPYTSPNCLADIEVRFKNITSASQIKVYENGTELTSGFNLNTQTWTLTTDRNISQDATYRFVATNAAGSESKEIVIKCTPPQKPAITLQQPSSEKSVSSNCIASIVAIISNFKKGDQLSVQENGKTLDAGNYNFNVTNGRLSMTRTITGTTVYKITATNSVGTTVKSFEITCSSQKVLPVITIINPKGNPYASANCMSGIEAQILNIEGMNNIEVYDNGSLVTEENLSWNPNTKMLTISRDVPQTSDFTIKASNSDGSASQTITIVCAKNLPNLEKK